MNFRLIFIKISQKKIHNVNFTMTTLYRKSHLLGTKNLKKIRKLNKLTLEDLSERCSQHSPKNAPSVSYLSMIENGKRLPSEEVLKQIAIVPFKKIYLGLWMRT
ncbi:MAG: hypothetical protein Ct9H300mP6_19420 [Gammaproteobacteria bacterium]|nr:MAG: hypothetical protein Ct9H300mP6_19420 [Gammaproteobacteria bacterium]